MATPPTNPTRPRRRPVRRFLAVMLDVRQRWWLALWFWLPVGAVVVVASHEAQQVLDPASLLHFGLGVTRWLAVVGIGMSLLHWLLRKHPSEELGPLNVRGLINHLKQ